MSDIFEMQEEGILCSKCCANISPPAGYMTKCDDCSYDANERKKRAKRKRNKKKAGE